MLSSRRQRQMFIRDSFYSNNCNLVQVIVLDIAASDLLTQKEICCINRVRAIGTEQSRLLAQNTAILVINSAASG